MAPRTQALSHSDAYRTKPEAYDASGYAVFSAGDIGSVHVMAHRMFDSGRIERGHAELGEWLDAHTGSGSEWVHLQFHMALFELELGDWLAARVRFDREILPVAATSELALTDAPALLWRLELTAPGHVLLPWGHLQRRALERMTRPSDPFIELHNLLALAGARDLRSLENWLRRDRELSGTASRCPIRRIVVALAAYIRGSYGHAARLMEDAIPRLSEVGGSRAQNALFVQMGRAIRQRAESRTARSGAATRSGRGRLRAREVDDRARQSPFRGRLQAV